MNIKHISKISLPYIVILGYIILSLLYYFNFQAKDKMPLPIPVFHKFNTSLPFGRNYPWWDDPYMVQCSEYMKNQPSTFVRIALEKAGFLRTIIKWNEDLLNQDAVDGHCGFRSYLKGHNQNVISYTLYNNNTDYWRGLKEIVPTAKALYEGWIVRLHVNPRGHQTELCPLLVNYGDIFDICDTINLPRSVANDTIHNPMLYRTAPLGDSLVDRMIFRDTDSKLSTREKAAVEEWINSSKPLHMMRDHYYHNYLFMGGMIGFYQPTDELKIRFDGIRRRLFPITGKTDQSALQTVMPADLVADAMQHDSFKCEKFNNTQPFPTKRTNGFFIGSRLYRYKKKNEKMKRPCPVACRPKKHRDWKYC